MSDLWSQYVDALGRGLRKDALRHLDAFIALLEAEPADVRENFCAWLCTEALDRRDGGQSWMDRDVPLQFPLSQRVMRPYFEDAYRNPEMPALRWLYEYPDWEIQRQVVAAVEGDVPNLQQAILDRAFSVAPRDPKLWSLRFQASVGALEYGSHHLHEGHGLVDGTDEEYQDLLREAHAVVDAAPDGALDAEDVADLALQERLYQDWFDYVATEATEPFVEWLKRRGRTYEFPTAYYYGK